MKPPYKVPSMDQIKATPPNGYNVVSTFSGAGGSCLGYRMAGYRVLWANEFIPKAQETYKANHPDSILDVRDIRVVQPQEIFDTIGLDRGEIDLFDGSPPCSAFSTAGKVDKGWGEKREYSGKKQRVDDLFYEYARLLEGLQPKVFVAENVTGLVKGKAKGYFIEILKTLKGCGYNVQARVLDASYLGVPQMRQRLIFIGVRNDLDLEPCFPKPLPYQYVVRDALPNITQPPLEQLLHPFPARCIKLWDETEIGGSHPKRFGFKKPHPDRPCFAILKTYGDGMLAHPYQRRYFSIDELKSLQSFPSDFTLTGSYADQLERIGRSVPPVMMMHIANAVKDGVLCKIK